MSRNATTAQALVEEVARSGQRCRPGEVSEVATAQLVVCATSAAAPLFAGQEVAEDALVVAVGSHEPDRRELDSTLLGRASVVVEDVDTALREAGDVVLALAEGALSVPDLVDLPTLLGGSVELRPGAPRVFKSVGMAWQDLAVATEVLRRVADPA